MTEMPILETRGISKHFGAVRALCDINLSIARGQVHALVGENGAGKSTLGGIISGVIRPDSGDMLIDGQKVRFASPRDALECGVAILRQEVVLVPAMSVAENVYLGLEGRFLGLFRPAQLKHKYRNLCQRTGFELPADCSVSKLALADKKKVELLRAVARKARLIVLDEPTAAMGSEDVERLLRIVRSLRDAGTTIVYVSHFLEEVLGLADTVTVLRNGEVTKTAPATAETPGSLVQAMLGRAIDLDYPEKPDVAPDAPVLLSVSHLTRTSAFTDVSLDVRAGEIVGLAGLVGAGQSEVARAIFGADRWDGGQLRIGDRIVVRSSPRRAIREGIAMIPSSRKTQGLVMQLPVGANVTLPHLRDVAAALVIRVRKEHRETRDLLQRLEVKPAAPAVRPESLSGGNQQKALFAKWLFHAPRVLIADEPTRGVDVGSRRSIYVLINSLAKSGMAMLLVSSELEELMGLAHRVLVMRRGRLVAAFEGDSISEAAIVQACLGAEAASDSPTGSCLTGSQSP